MAKEVVISTSILNSHGSRVLTEGIDTTQYRRNPVLLWMHTRGWDGDSMPIGRVENLRVEGDSLIGTPVFDPNDEFARRVADKWENGFLRAASAGIEIIETSTDPGQVLPGQWRATITRSKLVEVSIVDIGANDDALQLYENGRKMLKLMAGEESEYLPLINNNTQKEEKMELKTIALKLGLPETATEDDILSGIEKLSCCKEENERLQREKEQMELAGIEAAVDGAIADRRVTADKKEHFLELGKKVGVKALQETLSLMQPARKPTDVIREKDHGRGSYAKLSEVPAEELEKMKEEQPGEYARLYRAEYGMDIPRK